MRSSPFNEIPVQFTVGTPTYNRRNTLSDVYTCLCAQTFEDFEWIIVDDGSTDGTENLVRRWATEADFPIRYFYQPNSGKHVAFNRAVQEARGELYLSFDSDDLCLPQTLERFNSHWHAIPSSDREFFSGVSVLCMDERGRTVGESYQHDVEDVSSFHEQLRLRSAAERWGISRTNVLREFPYPEFSGERFMPDALVWNRIALKYKMRFVNDALRIYRRGPDGLMAHLLRVRLNSPRGAQLYYAELSRSPLPMADRLKALVNYLRFSLHAGRVSLMETGHPMLATSLMPAGYLAYWRDCLSLS